MWALLMILVTSTAALPSPGGGLTLEPSEAVVFPGDNVTFTCTSSGGGGPLAWEVGPEVAVREEEAEEMRSRIRVLLASRRMSGEIACVREGGERAVAFLVVNGVRNGGACRASSDCLTERAACVEGVCECPADTVRLRIKEKGFDVCRDMIHSLYDPCDYDEQCAHLVDPQSVCRKVCVCATWWTRDRLGKCVPTGGAAGGRSRSQEMYRVGLIAVTCLIILIVAVSLWVTLKRSCREPHVDSFGLSPPRHVDSDKPPSYDDIQVELETPPTLKDALKHSMTAKKLLRQVSAPAGQLLADIRVLKGGVELTPSGRDFKFEPSI